MIVTQTNIYFNNIDVLYSGYDGYLDVGKVRRSEVVQAHKSYR